MRGAAYLGALLLVLPLAGFGQTALSGPIGFLPAPVEQCHNQQRHGETEAAQACFEKLAASDDLYLRAEGDWGLENYAEANQAFRDAVAGNDRNALYRVRWGRLLQARFNDADAEGLFKEALQRDPNSAAAYLGLALVSEDGFDGKALEYAHKAVALDPNLAEAHVLLATLALEDSDSTTAAAESDRALKAQADDLDAMAVQAAVAVLEEQPPDVWLQRITALNPHYGRADAYIAEQLVINRRYQDAVTWYRKAIALDPQLWSAHSELGVTLMRLGQTDEPRQELELAYNHDYRDAATVNSLRLLDSYSHFDVIQDGPITLKLDKKESALLAPYFEALAQKALANYSAKYHMQAPAPVQIEAYPNHDDFAVRSIGLPGLGALGVTFGQVIAMDSPSARPPGENDWASTLWHEMDHVFVLTATHHLVPRWFAEGLAEHEQGQGNPEWADRITPDTLVAIHDSKLLPVDQLDSGFTHPTYPNQVIVSYYQAGRICDYIQQRWGADKLVEMVHDFAAPTTTAAVIRKALGMEPKDFDTAFDAWLRQDLGPEVDHFEAWRAMLKALVQLAGAQPPDEAKVEQVAQQVRDLYPDYVYEGNAYGFLAKAQEAQGQPQAAAATLLTYEQKGGHDPALLQQLADLQVKLQQPAAAADTLNRINDIYPMGIAQHRQLGTLWLQLGRPQDALREFAAVVALHPLDTAGAQYDLARAYFAAGEIDQAQTHVLSSLLAAHDFRPAQSLLLQIMQVKKKGAS